jgi:hypothetical protein
VDLGQDYHRATGCLYLGGLNLERLLYLLGWEPTGKTRDLVTAVTVTPQLSG